MRCFPWRPRAAGLAVAALACALNAAVAADPVQPSPAAPPGTVRSDLNRPRIGLVLSGGGARGGAHIGVLKVLEQMHVPIDVIVGTSAGAIVGAAYASGLPLAEIEKEMANLDDVLLFQDVDRTQVPFRRKADDGTNFLGPEFGVNRHGLSLPKGAVAGVALEGTLRRLTRRQDTADFDHLPIPFRAIATDLATAEMVVLSQGQLATATRASMAVPGAVTPVEIDGRMLVDGGLKRNLPVDVARQMGADIVIAVNIGTPLLKRDEITSVVSVSDQMLRILIEENVQASLRELRPGDVLITPELQGISSSDFSRLREAARRGERGAQAVAARLRAYAVPEEQYAELLAARVAERGGMARPIDEIRVTGTRRVNPEVVRAAMETQPGQTPDPERLARDVQRIYARGDFEAVSYTLIDQTGSGRVLLTEVSEKSWGPQYLGLGLSLQSDSLGNSFFNLYASHRSTWLNSLGGEWRNDLQVGSTDRVATEWYQPLTARQQLFVAPRAEFQEEPLDVYDDETNMRQARFRRQSYGIGVDVGVPLGTSGELRLGVARGRTRLRDDTTFISSAEVSSRQETGGLQGRLRYDDLDNARFPRSGVSADLRVFSSRPELGADTRYLKTTLNLQGATHRGPHTMRAALRIGRNFGTEQDLPSEAFTLGGFQQLSGYRIGQLIGPQMSLGRIAYDYRLAGVGLSDRIFIGGSYELGRVKDFRAIGGNDEDDAEFQRYSRLRRGRSLYVALDTALGPVYFAVGVGDSGNRTAYFFFGQP